jgi:glycerol-3-phosphate acyltransferase PlsY
VTHHLGPVLALVALGSFLVGSIPFGLIVGRAFYGSDIRGAGSGNIGAANALRTYGRGAGIAVLILDALKGALPTAIELHLAGDGAGATAALFTVLGHCYSPWLRYRGGKGVATWLGALCALSGLAGLTFAVVWLAVVARARVASLGSLVATIVSAVVLLLAYPRIGAIALAVVLVTIVIVLKHRPNIARLRMGREPRIRFGARSATASATGPSGRGG